MKTIIARLLASVVLSAAVTGAAVGVGQSQPIDGAAVSTAADLAAQLPRDTRFYRQTTWLDWDGTSAALGESVPEELAGESETVSVVAYDPQGQMIAMMLEESGRLMVSLYEYDAQGNNLGGTTHIDHALQSDIRYTYTYDEQGRELSKTTLDKGEPSGSAEVAYTPQADGTTLAEVTEYRADGETLSSQTRVLDNKNRIIHTELSLGGSVTAADYDYDEQDRLTRSVVKSGDGDITENIWTYTDAADGSYTCRYENYENGALQSRTEQQFDAFGVPVHQVGYDANGNRITEVTSEYFTP